MKCRWSMPDQPTLFLIAYDDGYLSELKVAFTDEILADEHAVETRGVVVPITVYDHTPAMTVRFTYTTTLDANGIVKRRDFHKTPEYEYENPIEVLPGATKSSVVSTRGYKTISTYGYDQSRTARDHEDIIKENKGIDL